MTKEETAEVLGRFNHQGFDNWWVRGDWVEPHCVAGNNTYGYDEFEAVAIAEKYLRDGVQPSEKGKKER